VRRVLEEGKKKRREHAVKLMTDTTNNIPTMPYKKMKIVEVFGTADICEASEKESNSANNLAGSAGASASKLKQESKNFTSRYY
jgi:hypothetical protein